MKKGDTFVKTGGTVSDSLIFEGLLVGFWGGLVVLLYRISLVYANDFLLEY